jgi:hypothetical protein
MTWKITIHTAPGALIAAEYMCPEHGRFAVDVPRDENGDPPATENCPARAAECRECDGPPDHCPECGAVYDAGCEQSCPGRPWHECGRLSQHVISAPGTAKVRRVEAHRGGYQKPEFETWTNTENLGEGQDLDDWKADRAKVWERDREREAMELARDL